MGAYLKLHPVFTDPAASADGTLTYTSRDTFQLNQLDSASVTATLPLKRLRKTQLFTFFQDEYKATPNINFNAGLRYQFFNAFREKNGRAVPFDFASCGGFCQTGAGFSSPRKNDIDPYVGLAWTPPIFRGKAVIRSSFGIYHGDGQLEDQNLPAFNDVPRYSLRVLQVLCIRQFGTAAVETFDTEHVVRSRHITGSNQELNALSEPQTG